MKIKTQSGMIVVNKRSHYAKWLRGWISGGGWTGYITIQNAYKRAEHIKRHDVSWNALGFFMAKEQSFGKGLKA
jgi:hypothetical protein